MDYCVSGAFSGNAESINAFKKRLACINSLLTEEGGAKKAGSLNGEEKALYDILADLDKSRGDEEALVEDGIDTLHIVLSGDDDFFPLKPFNDVTFTLSKQVYDDMDIYPAMVSAFPGVDFFFSSVGLDDYGGDVCYRIYKDGEMVEKHEVFSTISGWDLSWELNSALVRLASELVEERKALWLNSPEFIGFSPGMFCNLPEDDAAKALQKADDIFSSLYGNFAEDGGYRFIDSDEGSIGVFCPYDYNEWDGGSAITILLLALAALELYYPGYLTPSNVRSINLSGGEPFDDGDTTAIKLPASMDICNSLEEIDLSGRELETVSLPPALFARYKAGGLAISGVGNIVEASDFVIKDGVLIKYTGAGGEVEVPQGVTKIGREVFFDNKTITGITLPEGLISIGVLAFAFCEELNSSITLPKSLTSIDDAAFKDCQALTEIVIPPGVEKIGERAFLECSALETIRMSRKTAFPANGDENDAFHGCPGADHIHYYEDEGPGPGGGKSGLGLSRRQ